MSSVPEPPMTGDSESVQRAPADEPFAAAIRYLLEVGRKRRLAERQVAPPDPPAPVTPPLSPRAAARARAKHARRLAAEGES